MELEEYKFDIEYIKGKDNIIALSRISIDEIIDCNQNSAKINVTIRSMTHNQNQNDNTEGKNEEDNSCLNLSIYEDTHAHSVQ